MTREEIKKEIEELENREFYLQMKDRWDWKDYEISRKRNEEIRELKKQKRSLKVELKTVLESYLSMLQEEEPKFNKPPKLEVLPKAA